jgi:CDP-diacylglycerol--serine O-phosphatidyltransferase
MRYLIPNTITCLSLLCGFAAILTSADGHVSQAMHFIMAGALLDMLDGYIARRLHATSHFGQELDSLADVVVFGAAPAVILYQHYYAEVGWVGFVISAIPLLCAALRLARFNLTKKTATFSGLPCPAAAFILISCSGWFESHLIGLTALVISTGLLMVSGIPYPARLQSRVAAVALLPVIMISALLLPNNVIALWALGYGVIGVIQVALRWVSSQAALTAPPAPTPSNVPAHTYPPVNQTG